MGIPLYVLVHSRILLAQSSTLSDDALTTSQICFDIQNEYEIIWFLMLLVDIYGPEAKELWE